MMSEFELIRQYFTGRQPPQAHIPLGIGDDCALMSMRSGQQLAVSTDMLVEGRHFFAGTDPAMLGHKALAVNLSDLAAMGAVPRAFTLALALPAVEETWLSEFSKGMFALAQLHQCQLIGGDTTKGPLTISITVLGEISPETALRRDAAQLGDDVWVSGQLGEARLALAGRLKQHVLSAEAQHAADVRLHLPVPRVALGLALRGIARAAIDVSDGLVGDIGHILQRSGLGATLWCDCLPLGPMLALQNRAMQRDYSLCGGDDYELCFSAPRTQRAQVLAAAQGVFTPVTRIGYLEAEPGLRIRDASDKLLSLQLTSFDHFTS